MLEQYNPADYERQYWLQNMLDSVRGLMSVVGIGIVVVIFALGALRWPTATPNDSPVDTSAHILRVVEGLGGQNGAAPSSAITDIGIYLIVLICMGMAISGWRRGTRGAFSGLIILGMLGIAYSGSMALYTGPMVSLCGFSLILFGGLVTWIAFSGYTPEESNEKPKRKLKEDDYGSEIAGETGSANPIPSDVIPDDNSE